MLEDTKCKILVKTDQEPSIGYFIKDLIEAREDGRTISEQSPVKSSGSNGVAERAAQSVEGQLRIVLAALEKRLRRRIDAKEPIVTFMPEYAVYLLNRLEVGKDGKTPFERARGKNATVLAVEFGEKLLYKVRQENGKMAKIRERWGYGIFVGVRPRSGEVWVATGEKSLLQDPFGGFQWRKGGRTTRSRW